LSPWPGRCAARSPRAQRDRNAWPSTRRGRRNRSSRPASHGRRSSGASSVICAPCCPPALRRATKLASAMRGCRVCSFPLRTSLPHGDHYVLAWARLPLLIWQALTCPAIATFAIRMGRCARFYFGAGILPAPPNCSSSSKVATPAGKHGVSNAPFRSTPVGRWRSSSSPNVPWPSNE